MMFTPMKRPKLFIDTTSLMETSKMLLSTPLSPIRACSSERLGRLALQEPNLTFQTAKKCQEIGKTETRLLVRYKNLWTSG